MNRVGALAAVGLAASLSGCWWTGPELYAPDPAASAPIRPGRYLSNDGSGPAERLTITRELDGAWRIDEAGERAKTMRVVFAPLGPTMWVAELLVEPAPSQAVFTLAWRRGRETVVAPLPCEGAEAMAIHAGGAVRGDATNPECVFTDRGSLERAARAYLALHPRPDGTVLTRTGD